MLLVVCSREKPGTNFEMCYTTFGKTTAAVVPLKKDIQLALIVNFLRMDNLRANNIFWLNQSTKESMFV